MRSIGVDVDEGLVYEGDNNRGRGLAPTPVLFLATPLDPTINTAVIPESEDLYIARLVFREDSFEAVTRIRRGRFYERSNASQPHQWTVVVHPGSIADTATSYVGVVRKQLHGFGAWPARLRLKTGAQPTIVAFGARAAFTLWRVVDIERMITGEDLVTLRARSSFGLLPVLREEAVPEDALPKVMEILETLTQAAYSSAPASVIDRARDAAQWCIGVWWAEVIGDRSARTEDLSGLSKMLDREGRVVVASLARTIARLHARGKPNEQERRAVRPPMEGDAEYVITAMGLLMREIGWAS